MCRNIRPLFNFEPPATEQEIRAAATQYVRKVSGFAKPSAVNEDAFLAAVDDVSAATARALGAFVTSAPPRDREVERERAHERAQRRFGERTPA